MVDKSKLVLFIMVVSACRLASNRHNLRAKPPDLANWRVTLLAAEWENFLSVWWVSLKGSRISPIRKDSSFFPECIAPTSCQGLPGMSALFEFILLYLFSFSFSNHYPFVCATNTFKGKSITTQTNIDNDDDRQPAQCSDTWSTERSAQSCDAS